MKRNSSMAGVVFSLWVSAALILSAVITSPVQASAPDAKVRPPTVTPTPVVTSTPAPSVTPVTTETPTEVIPSISIQSNPTYIVPGGQVAVIYQISNYQNIKGTPAMRFLAPSGLSPMNPEEGKWDETERTFYLPVSRMEGKLIWQADETIVPPVSMSVELLEENEQPIAKAELILDALVEFKVEPAGAEVNGMNGRVKVTFPGGAVPETVQVKVTRPSEETLPVSSLSGTPFEITAVSEASRAEVTHFDLPVEIRVHYEDEGFGEEDDLLLFWYDPSDGQWKPPISQRLDTENNILIAWTDHFTVFDTYNSGWQSAQTPTMDMFQSPSFTGAGSYSMPINVPPGPGGLQPSLALSYNSQVVDSVSTDSQASWVGMGWSFDAGGYIELNGFGTQSHDDDTFTLNSNGMSGELWIGTDGRYHLGDENFANIVQNPNGTWKIQDKGGTTYYFDEAVGYTKLKQCSNPANNESETLTWRWMLSRVENIHGTEIQYEYDREGQTFVKNEIDCQTVFNSTHAIYPKTVTYDHGRYRVRFSRIARYDYKPQWLTTIQAGSFRPFQLSLLKTIYVEQDANGDGTFETVIRKYVLNYETDPAASIFPDYVWPSQQNYRTPTLKSVQEYGLNDAGPLPYYSFEYGDGMHLTHAVNGYGGEIDFTYEPWHETIPLETIPDGTLEPDIPRWGSPIKCQFENSACGWILDITGYQYPVTGGNNGYIRINQKVRKEITSFQPGHWYRIVAQAKAVNTNTPTFSLGYGYYMDGVQYEEFPTSKTLNATLKTVVTEPFFLPRDATRFMAKMNSSGLSEIYWFYLVPLPTFGLVDSRTISDGSNDYITTYDYDGAATNNIDNSDVLSTGHPRTPAYTEFRGHASVTESDLFGKHVVTMYGQSDCLRGRPTSIATYNGSALYQVSTTEYECSEWDSPTLLIDENWPLDGEPHQSTPYTGLRYRWVRVDHEENAVYQADGATTAGSLTTSYDYEPTYGNLISQEVAGSIPHTLTTTYQYLAPIITTEKYIVSLPSSVSVDNGADTLAETLYYYDANGIPTKTRALMSAGQYSQMDFGYDAWGNVTSQTVYTDYSNGSSDPASGAQTTTTVYDSVYHTYPISITAPPPQVGGSGFTTTINYSAIAVPGTGYTGYTIGAPVSAYGPNGTATTVSAEYDLFGRLVKLIRPGDDSASPTLQIAYTGTNPFTTVLTQKIQNGQFYTVTRQYDGLGRPTSATAGGVTTTYQYGYVNISGQLHRYDSVSMPGDTQNFATTIYDSLGRAWTATAPDGSATTYAYDGLETTVTDANSNSTSTTADILGRTRFVDAPIGPDITFDYDDLGNLISAERGGAETTIQYDLGGRKTSMSDPDMGAWTYDYDALSNLKLQTDARGCTLSMNYDSLNRLTTKASSGNCGQHVNVTYGYDAYAAGSNYGIGFRTSMSDGTSALPSSWEYDYRGRLVKEIKRIDAQSFTTEWTYNSADLPVSMIYPDGEVVTNQYNSYMQLINVAGTETYASSFVYDSASRLKALTIGADLGQRYYYKDWNVQGGGRLDMTVTGTGAWTEASKTFATTLLKNTYSYDSVGNITSIFSVAGGSSTWSETQTFGYDALYRLTSASATGGQADYSESYTYEEASGNLKTRKNELTNDTMTLTYPAANGNNPTHPHAATGAGNNTYEYDFNGNQSKRTTGVGIYQLGYDAENRLVSVTGPSNFTATFDYDGDGRRVKSVVNGETILFAGGHYELKGNEVTKYYFAGASRIAVRKYIVPQSSTLTYLAGDHLGSTSLAVDASTGEVIQTRYKPWGEVRYTTPSKTLPTRYTFTGQYSYISDDATDLGAAGFGLMFYNARWYDPALGRFAQADTIVPGGVQGLDRYAYVNNSPVMYIDPSGHCPEDDYECRNRLAATLLYPSKPEHLSPEGEIVYQTLWKLGLWGDLGGAMLYVVATEFGPGNIDNPNGLNKLTEAMSRRFHEYCEDGPWSAECLVSFWGYMEGILQPDTEKATKNYADVKKDHLASANALAQTIINPSDANWKHGCNNPDGSPQVCGWATISSGGLYTCLKTNENCWAQNPNTQQFVFGNTAYVTWLAPSGAAFIVLTLTEQSAICVNPLWNLPETCSLLEIP